MRSRWVDLRSLGCPLRPAPSWMRSRPRLRQGWLRGGEWSFGETGLSYAAQKPLHQFRILKRNIPPKPVDGEVWLLLPNRFQECLRLIKTVGLRQACTEKALH